MKIHKEERSDGDLQLVLEGQLNEHDHFEAVREPARGRVLVKCRDVTRINSVGIKTWINYFQSLRKQGAKLVFQDVSTVLARQANLVINFIQSDEVESICIPYLCGVCGAETDFPASVQTLKGGGPLTPMQPCAKCGAPASLDLEQDGLVFLGIPRR